MNFVSNKINIGTSKSFQDIVNDYLKAKNEKTVKVASTNSVVKTAKEEEAKSSGQLDVEPLHQTGESTNQDSVAGGKGDEKGKSKGKSNCSCDEEGKDSGQPKAEAKLTNDPKVEASTETETKEAGMKGNCEKCKKPNFICKGKCSGEATDEKKEDKVEDKKDDKKEAKVVFKKIANLTSKEKTKLKEYWKTLYPSEFVEAMLEEK